MDHWQRRSEFLVGQLVGPLVFDANKESIDHALTVKQALHLPQSHSSFASILATGFKQQWSSPGHKAITFFIICNVVWYNRNRGRHEGLFGHSVSIIVKITQHIGMVCSNPSLKFSSKDRKFLESLNIHPQIKVPQVKVLRWSALPPGRFKLSCDGASKGNPGMSGGGAVLRDSSVMVVWACCFFFGKTTNIVAECAAFFKGLQVCHSFSQFAVDIELDSQNLLQDMDWKVVHIYIYRKVNKAADFLAMLRQALFCSQHI